MSLFLPCAPRAALLLHAANWVWFALSGALRGARRATRCSRVSRRHGTLAGQSGGAARCLAGDSRGQARRSSSDGAGRGGLWRGGLRRAAQRTQRSRSCHLESRGGGAAGRGSCRGRSPPCSPCCMQAVQAVQPAPSVAQTNRGGARASCTSPTCRWLCLASRFAPQEHGTPRRCTRPCTPA